MKSLPVQDGGERTEIIHDNTKLADVTLSAFPSNSEKRECVHVTGQSGPFVISDISHWVEDGEQETAIFLFEVEDGEASAKMADIQSHLKGQRDSARNRVLEEDGLEAYQEMLDRIKEQTD